MKIEKNFSLKNLNSFGLDVKAKEFVKVDRVQDLQTLLETSQPKLILGGGSNILFTGNVDGLVLKNAIPGKEIIKESPDFALIRFGAGENWHQCVLWAIQNGFGGIENLSLIPGCMGAAPIQNIGAYGVELESVFQSLEAVHLESGEVHHFQKQDCQFGYRHSIFKTRYRGLFCITSVSLKLSKKPVFNISYGAVTQTLDSMSVRDLSLEAISKAVIHIRQSKLPDPKILGNAGSFFKNPEIHEDQFADLKSRFPEIVYYPLDHHMIKIPAGWLIEQCGWKGKVVGNTGAHKDQALVLVNYGGASGQEIRDLAFRIQDSVYEKFGIKLSPEVQVV